MSDLQEFLAAALAAKRMLSIPPPATEAERDVLRAQFALLSEVAIEAEDRAWAAAS